MIASGRFVELDKAIHDRSKFDCGNESLNDFLKTKAAKHRVLKVSRTMVLPRDITFDGPQRSIRSYYTTSLATVQRDTLPNGYRLPQYPVPVFLIARLAVANEQKGKGIGKITLIKAMENLYRITREIQAVAIVVDPIDKEADRFYRHFDFQDLNDSDGRLFIPMNKVIALFS